MVGISIIVPVLDSKDTLLPLAHRILDLYRDFDTEIIFVDDGSQDGTQAILERLERDNPNKIKVYFHQKNYGEHSAIYTGFKMASKGWAITLACDFQNPPEEIIKLVLLAENKKFDVVYGQFIKKEHSVIKNMISSIANHLATIILKKPHDLHLSNFKCLSRKVYQNMVKGPNPLPLIDSELLKQTRNIGSIAVIHQQSIIGKSNYNLERYISLLLRISYNVVPKQLKGLILRFYSRYFPVLN